MGYLLIGLWPAMGLSAAMLWFVLVSNFFTLRGIPGPVLARFSNLWRLYMAYQGDMHHTYIELHHWYGNAVRIGPNCVSLAGVSARTAIYGISRPIFSKVFLPAASFDPVTVILTTTV
jgi:hypothetical protein